MFRDQPQRPEPITFALPAVVRFLHLARTMRERRHRQVGQGPRFPFETLFVCVDESGSPVWASPNPAVRPRGPSERLFKYELAGDTWDDCAVCDWDRFDQTGRPPGSGAPRD